MSLTFDCTTMLNYCPTASNCSKTTKHCETCLPGWEHSTFFIKAHDCMQPAHFSIVFLVGCIVICGVCLGFSTYWSYTTHSAPAETHTVGGWLHIMWSKQFLALVNGLLQIVSICTSIACYIRSGNQFVATLWCVTGMCSVTIMYCVKQRMVHPAFVLHRDAGRRRIAIERWDFTIFMVGMLVTFLSLDLCGVAAFLNLDSMYNSGILMFLAGTEFLEIISLMEMVWMSHQVKLLQKSLVEKHESSSKHSSVAANHNNSNHHHHHTSLKRPANTPTNSPHIGSRSMNAYYSRDGGSKEEIDDPFSSTLSFESPVGSPQTTPSLKTRTLRGEQPTTAGATNTTNASSPTISTTSISIMGSSTTLPKHKKSLEHQQHSSGPSSPQGTTRKLVPPPPPGPPPPVSVVAAVVAARSSNNSSDEHSHPISVHDVIPRNNSKEDLRRIDYDSVYGSAGGSTPAAEFSVTRSPDGQLNETFMLDNISIAMPSLPPSVDESKSKLGIAMARVKSIGRASSILFLMFQPLIIVTITLPIFGTLPFASMLAALHIWVTCIMMTFLTYRVVGSSHIQFFPMSSRPESKRILVFHHNNHQPTPHGSTSAMTNKLVLDGN
jgi:hypothetical protein